MKFNLLTIIGLVLLAAGVAFFLGVGIPGQETVLDVGGLQASIETERQVSPVISGVLAALGLGGIFFGQKQ